MPNNITAPRVPLTDPRTGLISREWYNFFLSLWELAGSGQNAVSLTDVQVAPSTVDVATLAELAKVVQGLQVEPPTPPSASTSTTTTATLDFGNTAANTSTDLTVSVPGAVSGDVVTLGVPGGSVPANGTYFAWVSAADVVTVRYANNSAGALDPASGTFRVVVTRY